jgi:ribokinase
MQLNFHLSSIAAPQHPSTSERITMILVAGSANLDFITRVPHNPVPGETVLGTELLTAPGGKGANQAVACARAGGQVAFLGALGNDIFAHPLRQSLQINGVHDQTITVNAATGAAFITVSEQGENTIAVASGANSHLSSAHLGSLKDLRYLVMQLEIPVETVLAFARAAKQANVKIILNAAPARALPAELLTLVDLLIVNEGELTTLAGDMPLLQQLQLMSEQVAGTVLVTLGSQGSVAFRSGQCLEQAAYAVTVRDTTGAGDTYVGVLVAALCENLTLEQAMRQASVGAGLACTKEGAQPSMPTLHEIQDAMQ